MSLTSRACVRLLIVAASDASERSAAQLADFLGPRAVLVCPVRSLMDGIDRGSVDVALVAADEVAAQRAAVHVLKGFPAPLPVLVESDVTNASTLVSLMRAGADGVVPPEAATGSVWRSVEAALAGEVVLPRAAVRHLAAELRLAGLRDESSSTALRELSVREREVILLLYSGRSTTDVAHRLFLSSATVRSHVHTVFQKLGVDSRDEVFRLLDEQ